MLFVHAFAQEKLQPFGMLSSRPWSSTQMNHIPIGKVPFTGGISMILFVECSCTSLIVFGVWITGNEDFLGGCTLAKSCEVSASSTQRISVKLDIYDHVFLQIHVVNMFPKNCMFWSLIGGSVSQRHQHSKVILTYPTRSQDVADLELSKTHTAHLPCTELCQMNAKQE